MDLFSRTIPCNYLKIRIKSKSKDKFPCRCRVEASLNLEPATFSDNFATNFLVKDSNCFFEGQNTLF